MNIFSRLFRRRHASGNVATELARARFARTMPGQTGAMAASRYGYIIN